MSICPPGAALALCLVLCLAGVGACGAPQSGPGLLLRMAAAPPCPGGCLTADGQPLSGDALLGITGTLRISVLRHDAAGGTSFVCDSLVHVPQEAPDLDLGEVAGGRFDIHGELFDQAGVRIASGVVPGLSLPQSDPGPLRLQLYLTSRWSCPEGSLGAARAFHSATVLPDGEVLLVGGMAPLDAKDTTGTFQLLGSAEIFDPRTSLFSPLSASLLPRAFHQVAVLDQNDTTVHILLYGGLTAGDARAVSGQPNAPPQLRFAPIDAIQAPPELLTYDRAKRQITAVAVQDAKLAVAFAGAAQVPAGGLLAVGGETYPGVGQAQSPAPAQKALLLSSAGGRLTVASQAITPWLIAPSVTALSPDSMLVLGAARSLPAADPQVALMGLRASGLPGGLNVSGAFAVDGPATVFHTATLLSTSGQGGAQVLVTGGFVLDPTPPIQALQPPDAGSTVRLYQVPAQGVPALKTVTPYDVAMGCGMATTHYRPAGFEAASTTYSGRRVVVTGGTPTAPPVGTADCEDGDTNSNKLLCVLRQASLYDGATGKLTSLPAMPLGRMGHRQTTLPDGSILVTGGLYRPGGDLAPATAEAEVYNPRASDASKADIDDPIAPLLTNPRQGMALANPCKTL